MTTLHSLLNPSHPLHPATTRPGGAKLHTQRGLMTFDPDSEAVEALQCQGLDPLTSAGYVISEDLQEGEIEFLRQVVQPAPDTTP